MQASDSMIHRLTYCYCLVATYYQLLFLTYINMHFSIYTYTYAYTVHCSQFCING